MLTYLQRIAQGTREIRLERYNEALYDPSANLTYTALTGTRKQSVSDAEHLFSPELARFMRGKGYLPEEKYITVVGNWRAGCDERGLSELQRSKYNYGLLNYILEDLMPWHEEYDFSYIEVNRYDVLHACMDSNYCFSIIIGMSVESKGLLVKSSMLLLPMLNQENGEDVILLPMDWKLSTHEPVPQMTWNAFLVFCVNLWGRILR